MVPMRSVPHRVVCLVGLDDGVFPRLGVVDGDDALARNPMTGERDIRSEDRQLLLDAIGAATEKLVITYTGANEYSGSAASARGAAGRAAGHPRHDDAREGPRAVSLSGIRCSRSTFATSSRASWCRACRSASTRPCCGRPASASANAASSPKFISGPLPPPPADDVVLADLVGFFKDPVKGFFRALEYTLPWDVDGVEDAMPGRHRRAGGMDRRRPDAGRHPARHDPRRRAACGMAPRHAAAGSAGLAQGHRDPRSGRRCWRPRRWRHRQADAQAYDVDIDLGSGRRLTGTVSPVFGDRLVSVTYSKLDGKHLLESWIPLLALIAHDPSRDWSAVCIGRAKRGTTPRLEGLGPPEDAVEVLRELVAIYDAGRREPIPLPIKTSYAWAAARHCGDDPVQAASYRWKSSDRYPGEDKAPAHVRAWGRDAWLADLMQPLRPGEQYDGEDNRLGAYAARLWLPMLRAGGARRDGALRPAGPAARRTVDHGAGSQRRHRQDVRAGRAGDAVCRRGRGDAGPDAAHHVRPGGQPGAARAGPRPDRRRAGRFRRPVDRRRQPGGGASARRHRRGARRAAAAVARCAGGLRCGDDRHHSPVLPAGAEIAGRGRRHRRRCHAGREPRRAGRRDRRRPVPRPFRPGARRPRADLPRRAAARPRGGQEPVDRAAAARPGTRLTGGGLFGVCESCCRRAGNTQAAARHPRLRRPARSGWPPRWTPTTPPRARGCISAGPS